jgi:hypothetical protein
MASLDVGPGCWCRIPFHAGVKHVPTTALQSASSHIGQSLLSRVAILTRSGSHTRFREFIPGLRPVLGSSVAPAARVMYTRFSERLRMSRAQSWGSSSFGVRNPEYKDATVIQPFIRFSPSSDFTAHSHPHSHAQSVLTRVPTHVHTSRTDTHEGHACDGRQPATSTRQSRWITGEDVWCAPRWARVQHYRGQQLHACRASRAPISA